MGACNSNEKNRPNSYNMENIPKNQIICKQCNLEFDHKSLSTQSTHEDNINNSDQTYNRQQNKCQTINEILSESDIETIQNKYEEAYEQHFLRIHFALYEPNQKIYYCKFMSTCSYAHKNYKEVEQHAIDCHLSDLEKTHHKKFLQSVSKGEIGLNKNGSRGYFCTTCQILFDNFAQHERVSSHKDIKQQKIQSIQEQKQSNQNNKKQINNNSQQDAFSFSQDILSFKYVNPILEQDDL